MGVGGKGNPGDSMGEVARVTISVGLPSNSGSLCVPTPCSSFPGGPRELDKGTLLNPEEVSRINSRGLHNAQCQALF